jgi:serine/threonine protein kinase
MSNEKSSNVKKAKSSRRKPSKSESVKKKKSSISAKKAKSSRRKPSKSESVKKKKSSSSVKKAKSSSRKPSKSADTLSMPVGYTYVSTLGEGSYGKVIKAKDKDGNTVAIKFQKESSKKANEDYEREIRNLSAFSDICNSFEYNVSLVCIRESGKIDNKYYIVMDYIEGETLDEFYENHYFASNKEREDQLEKHFKTLLTTVQLMHFQGFSHSDIKPANIIIDKNKRLHLVDLGAACNKTPCSTIATPYFLAPDVEDSRRDLEKRQSGDIYAIGASLLYILDKKSFNNYFRNYTAKKSNTGNRAGTAATKAANTVVDSEYLKKVLHLMTPGYERDNYLIQLYALNAE